MGSAAAGSAILGAPAFAGAVALLGLGVAGVGTAATMVGTVASIVGAGAAVVPLLPH
ncbi:hypothetical protein [Nocardia stercoris]|uniref:hypothetical protein n=1 Tax=Nocardia stercoris TaxID=2483361 RepID=UPI00131A24C0|nr:hypothetical protein [Nocardia stercoris]